MTNDSGDQFTDSGDPVEDEGALSWEDKTTRVFVQLNVLWGTMTARLMVMLMNETIVKPWIGQNEGEIWCAPDHRKFMKILGLKPMSNKDNRKYYKAIDTLNENGFAAKQITKVGNKKQMILAVNFERIDELLLLPRYVSSVPAVLLQEQKYSRALEKMHAEQDKQPEERNVTESTE